MNTRYFVTAIGTDSGKTLISAMLTKAVEGDYWKPIQAGLPRDTDTVQSLFSDEVPHCFEEAYLLHTPASPHAAAAIDGITIELSQIKAPETDQPLVVEGAGGVLVPLNDEDMVIDLAAHLDCEVILVSNLYLGSINHTLLTVNELKRRGLPVKGIIFNGPSNPESERIILHHAGWPCLLHVPQLEEVTPEVVREYAEKLREKLTA
ncbi:MAG TPA: dethiobiotin synthase [Cytophagales bacterium]|nr:dethiobiotin synthase [Cytophagales bacterium]HAA20420.1 dethiobiotin synthase [Cytophagales bacterium]HAP58356.1 dethiobiotin synthase [Cytophagales bacterium]